MIHEALSESECYLYALMMDESGVDLAEFLLIDDTKLDEKTGEQGDGCFRAYPFQVAWWRNKDQRQVTSAGRSVGKALDIDTPILTTKGWTTMGEIKVGDFVFSEEGSPVMVTEAFDILYGRPCYEIVFDDGSRIIADRDHQWVTNKGLHTTSSIENTIAMDHRIEISEALRNPAPDSPIAPYVGSISEHIIREINKVSTRPVRCISVDGDSHLFLAGKELVPTHNSLSVKLRVFAFPFLHTGEEMVVTAPESRHLDALTTNIENLFDHNKLAREMLVKGKKGIRHRTFKIQFANGSHLEGIIPQRDGRGLKGTTAAGSLTLTKDRGFIPIEDVVEGDYVWSHELEWNKVLDTYSLSKEGYKIKGQGGFEMNVTDNHRFYARNDKSKQPGKTKRDLGGFTWEWADDLTSSKYLPINAYWTGCTYFGDPLDIPQIDYSSCKTSFEMDEDFWWLVGRYTADGAMSGRGSAIYLFIHPDNQPPVIEVLDRIGASYSITTRKHSSVDKVSFQNSALRKWLYDNFGHHSHHKELPTWCLTMPEEWRRALLEGYLAGDGSKQLHGKQYRDTISSASKKLTLGYGSLASTLGYHIGYSTIEVKVDEIMGVKLIEKPADSHSCRLNKKGTGLFDKKGYVSYKIKSAEPIGEQEFHGLVTEGGSYFAEGVFHHNSHPLILEQDECFPAGSLVLTKNGQVPIEQVEIGMEVWTHKNRWRKVTNTFDRGPQDMVKISGAFNDGLVCSSDHKFWIAEQDNLSEPSFVKAIELGPNHLWATPFEGDKRWGYIESVENLSEKINCYDIEVEEDHSFVIEGIFCKNSQDFTAAAWEEIVETVKIQNPAARWRASGVTRGVGDKFDEKASGKESGWTVHRLPALLRPNWNEEEKRQKIEEYGGSSENIGYRRNVLGLSGDMNAPLFNLSKLANCAPGITPILTYQEGGKDISGRITTLSDVIIGDKVGPNQYVEGIFLSEHRTLLKIAAGGEDIYVSPEHRFFTDRGWVEALDLRTEDSIFTEEALRALQRGDFGKGQEGLFERLLVCFERGEGPVL